MGKTAELLNQRLPENVIPEGGVTPEWIIENQDSLPSLINAPTGNSQGSLTEPNSSSNSQSSFPDLNSDGPVFAYNTTDDVVPGLNMGNFVDPDAGDGPEAGYLPQLSAPVELDYPENDKSAAAQLSRGAAAEDVLNSLIYGREVTDEVTGETTIVGGVA